MLLLFSCGKSSLFGIIFLIIVGKCMGNSWLSAHRKFTAAQACNLNDELVMIKCASKLIDGNFLGENLSFSLKETGQLCQRYQKFKECVADIEESCLGGVANLQTFFSFLCSDDFRLTAVQERPCLTLIDENSELSHCLRNATSEFELEFSNSSSAILWKHEIATCRYVQLIATCYTEYSIMKSCQKAVWVVSFSS